MQWASSSVYYLLGLWSRLVSSVPFLKSDSPTLLDSYVPKITEAYITSRFDSVQVRLSEYSAHLGIGLYVLKENSSIQISGYFAEQYI